jgi:DNA polymerase V
MSSTKQNRPVFALADANTFYVSCERVFRPDLVGVPLVALSNNDGCVIAQSKEVKQLGIPMAGAWFEYEKAAKALGVIDFSSNYELYANMSNRFMDTLREFSPRIEVYSIDECFLDLTGMNRDLVAYGQEMKEKVWLWSKLPICVGIGHSKTLAKLANHCAKKQPVFNGVCDFTSLSEAEVDAILEKLAVDSVWGVGSRLAAKLERLGIKNVLRLKKADPKRIRDQFGVLMERTIKELNGEVWLDLDQVIQPSKQVMSSRSFGARVTTLDELKQAVSFHASNACERMRKQKLFANAVYVFIQNSPFDQAPYYAKGLTVALPSLTDCTLKITHAALWLLKQIYAPGVYYQKAGVMLMELVPAGGQQTDLFGYSSDPAEPNQLMGTLDRINKKYSRGTIRLASEGMKKTWVMRRGRKSPNYTGDFDELPVAKA